MVRRLFLILFLLVVSVGAMADTTTHGMTIPSAHPRLWWTSARISQAQTWRASNPSASIYNSAMDPLGYLTIAWNHVVSGSDCSSAVTWAVGYTPGHILTTDIGSDDMRDTGETAIIVYDWCYDQWSSGQKTTFISNWNTWVGNVSQQTWGGYGGNGAGVWMDQNNYFWGNVRNEFEWAIASYTDNSTQAEIFLNDSLNTRWAQFVTDATAGGESSGGVTQEGLGYGVDVWYHMIVPFQTASNLGRDLANETGFEKANLYWLLYDLMPAQTYNRGFSSSEWLFGEFNEDNVFDPGDQGGQLRARSYYQNWLMWASNYWSGIDAGKYARQLLTNVNVSPSKPPDGYQLAQDLASTTKAFSSLTLDYYATGYPYYVARKAWDTSSAVAVWQMGTGGGYVGHQHWDYGNFQLWRGGRWLTRETSGYSQSVPNYNNAASGFYGTPLDSVYTPAHNVIMLNGYSAASRPTNEVGNPTIVTRLESQTSYSYSAANLTGFYTWDGYPGNEFGMGHYEREYIFIRSLETLIVFDRVLSVNSTVGGGTPTAANAVKTFLLHFENNPTLVDASHMTMVNGTQELFATRLLPTSTTRRVINEATCYRCSASGQYRVEEDQTGTPQSYFLYVLQGADSGATPITASVVDSNSGSTTSGTFTVTLHPATGADTVCVLNKGQTSTGGTCNIAGAGAVSLRANVQGISYTDSGPSWITGTAYTLTTATAGSGSGSVIGCGGAYASGDAYSCTASASSGSTFASWASSPSCGGTASGTTYSGTMPANDCTVTATFNTSGGPTLTSITVSPSSASITTTGTQQFTAACLWSDSTTVCPTLSWASSTTGVATINSSTGLATAVSAGASTITAANSGVTSNGATLTVAAPVTVQTQISGPFCNNCLRQ